MYVLSRLFTPRGLASRFTIGALLAFVLFFNSVGTLFASTTGGISGTVTGAQGGQGLAGVKVAAVSPSSRYGTVTDGKGFFSMLGMDTDTYTLSFELAGYQPQSITGVNVFADQNVNVSPQLTKSLITIGRVVARSVGGAFQPSQTSDTYTVTSSQIANQLGKSDSVSETNLIFTLPGSTRDSSGYPVIRGGRENEEGFQYEGIPYTDAFTSQFINSLALNPGVFSLQLTPGAGDASIQSQGTGTLNLISKRGTRPAFGSLDFEALTSPMAHQFATEYGFASPDGRFSNYVAFQGNTTNAMYQAHNADSTRIGTFFSQQYQTSRDLTDNFFYKFGRDLNQSVQVFYQNQSVSFFSNNGGLGPYTIGSAAAGYGPAPGLCYNTCDPIGLATDRFYTGMTNNQIQRLAMFYPGQPNAPCPAVVIPGTPLTNGPLAGTTSITQACSTLNHPIQQFQPNDTFKIQYSNNLDASTFVTAKFFHTNSVSTFDLLNNGTNYFDEWALQGGQDIGVALDLTKQLNSKNLLKVGANYYFLHPIDNFTSGMFGLLAATGFGNTGAGFDFLPPGEVIPGYGFASTGYVYNAFGGNPPPVPETMQNPTMNRQDWGVYLNDTFSPTDRFKIDLGVRVDGSHFALPSEAPCNVYTAASAAAGIAAVGSPWTVDAASGANQCLYQYTPGAFNAAGQPIVVIDPQARSPVVPQPRIAFSWQIGRNDAIRASYGRTVEFAPIADVDSRESRGYFDNGPFGMIAPDPIFGGISPGLVVGCGVTGNTRCSSLGEQLYWDNQTQFDGVPIEPVKPETFNNFDFSFSHQFPANIALKVTPFYRRGFDALVLSNTVKTDKSGNPLIDPTTGGFLFNPSVSSNLGIEKTTGVEMQITRDLGYGISGEFAATYINELSNVVPLSSSEDFFPAIPAASLALGNLYRVGFLSPFTAALALQYKSRGGLRINPVTFYVKGYPIGNGLITANYVNNVPMNIPSTNVSFSGGSTGAMQYVDPMNPGSITRPNIAATRGSALSASPGGVLTNNRNLFTNLDIEFQPPGSRNNFGLFITNLFGNVYGLPVLNSRWQPVATGIGGPKTGTTNNVLVYPNEGQVNYAADRFGFAPFIISPTGTPTEFRLYYQLAL